MVLPEPLGPMRPVTLPSRTRNEQPSTAVIPPKRLTSPRTSSASAPRGALRAADRCTILGTSCRRSNGTASRAPRRPRSQPDTVGSRPCGRNMTTATRTMPNTKRWTPWAAIDVVGELVHGHHQRGAQDRAPDRPEPPDEGGEHDLDADEDVEHAAGVDERQVVGVDASRDADEHAARDRRQDLVDGGAHPDRGRLVLVLADGDEAHAELRPADPPAHQHRQRHAARAGCSRTAGSRSSAPTTAAAA